MQIPLFYVGFFSPSEPGMIQRWRPKLNSPENVPITTAQKRFRRLAKRMKQGQKVDGLRVASVALYTADGMAIRSRTADGTEAKATPEDACTFLQTAPIRGVA